MMRHVRLRLYFLQSVSVEPADAIFPRHLSAPSFRAIFPRHLSALISSLLCLAAASSCLADDPPASGHLSLYVNGTLQGSADCPSSWKATGHTQIGHGLFDGKPVDFVNGLLGDVRVYDRALSAAQIQALYAQGPQTQWQLDHTAGAAQG